MKGFEAMSDKKRHTIWIDERIWEDVLSHYKSDNCSTQNEFVENALRFYIGYLNTKNAGAFLPQAISSVMIGTISSKAATLPSGPMVKSTPAMSMHIPARSARRSLKC